MDKGLKNLTNDMFELHESRARYRTSFYGIGLGFALCFVGLVGIEGPDAAEFAGLGLAGLTGLRGYFAHRKAERLEIEVNERLKELKERGYIREK